MVGQAKKIKSQLLNCRCATLLHFKKKSSHKIITLANFSTHPTSWLNVKIRHYAINMQNMLQKMASDDLKYLFCIAIIDFIFRSWKNGNFQCVFCCTSSNSFLLESRWKIFALISNTWHIFSSFSASVSRSLFFRNRKTG
jgi:hypothetical protein